MNDRDTTISQMQQAVLALCRRKGWGDKQGIQNPQHVAMAMTVEMSELLEHFQWLNSQDVDALMAGKPEREILEIGEEFADVMMYGLQLAYSLHIDVAANIERKIGIVEKRPSKSDDAVR